MPIKINYSKNTYNENSSNLVLFSNDNFNLNNLKKFFKLKFSYINDLLKTSDLKKSFYF